MIPYQAVRQSKKAMLFVIAAFTMPSLMAQNNRHEFSVQQAVEYAMKNSTQVKKALTDVKIQYQTNREITSAAYPQINGSVSATKFLDIATTLIPAEFNGGPPGTYFPVQFGTKYNANYGLDVQQLLFDGQVFVGLQARSTSIIYANLTVDVTAEQIKANIYKIYYQLVIGKKQLGTYDANIERLKQLTHETDELFKNGFAEKLDLDKATVNLSNLTTDRNKLVSRLQTGTIGLKYLMGMPVKEEIILTDTVNEAVLKEDLQLDAAFRYEDRKEMQLLQSIEKLRTYDIKRHKLSYIPKASLAINYGRSAQRNKFNFFDKHEDWFTSSSVGIRIDVPIFDGFAKDSRIKKAKLEVEKVQYDIADLKNNIDLQIDTARIGLSTALITMNEQTKNMQLAEQVYNQTKLKYHEGLGSNLEITNAETELKTAQNNYYSALYDAIIAKVEFLRATGKLLPNYKSQQ